MFYMITLTLPQALFTGTVGCVCLGTSYGLMQIIERTDRIGCDKIETMKNTTALNDKITPTDRISSTLSIYMKKMIVSISTVARISLSLLVVLLWGAGAACITYAVVGPLLV